MEKNINLLVLTSMWPENSKDISGIFIVDYVKAVQAQCRVSVLVLQISGNKKGLTIDESDGVKVFKYCVSKSHPKGIIKYLLYLKWFYQGRKLGSMIPGINLIHAHGSTLSCN